MKKIAAAMLGLCGLVFAGCFDIEQTLTLEKNLSGKAGFAMKVNMEPMVGFMVRMQREMEGKTGEPTAAELDKARKEFLASKKSETTPDFEKDKKELQQKLPKGVTLLDSSFKDEGLKIAANFLFGFDNVSKLSEIQFPKKKEEGAEQQGPGGGPGNPVESPFNGLKVVDEGSTILVTSPTENPVADQQEQTAQMELDPAAKKQMEEMFKGLRVAFKITAPFQVVEHNAHRKEGNTLIWEYDLKTFEKMKPEDLAQGVRVRYKK